MKTLFAITVLIAGIYLFVQQEGLDKLSQYLPQNQIDKSAETLLTNVNQNVAKQVDKQVDEKIELFKSSLLIEKNTQINTLEKKIEDLQAQFITLQSQQLSKNALLKNTEQEETHALKSDESPEQHFTSEPALAETQYLTDESSITALLPVTISTERSEEKKTIKQQAIKRQANLQDIAERMNQTSLLALTQ